jgi:hypothetical protein
MFLGERIPVQFMAWRDGMEDDLRMLNVRGWRRRVLDRKEWKKCLRSGQGPKWAAELLVVLAIVIMA